MADTGIEYLDEIGLILNIMVLGFMLLFLIPTMKQRDKVITAFFSCDVRAYAHKESTLSLSGRSRQRRPENIEVSRSVSATAWKSAAPSSAQELSWAYISPTCPLHLPYISPISRA